MKKYLSLIIIIARGEEIVEWLQSVSNAIRFIEENLTEEIDVSTVSRQNFASDSNFSRIFSIVTGVTVSDYIRFRRLTEAGHTLAKSKGKIIDTAMRYQYDTSESFSKAFMRFHSITPSQARNGDALKTFEPLTIEIIIRGGFNMEHKIMETKSGGKLVQESFEYKTLGAARFVGKLTYDEPKKVIPTIEPLMPKAEALISDYCLLEYSENKHDTVDTHIVGRFYPANTDVPSGLTFFDIPTVNIAYSVYKNVDSFNGDLNEAHELTCNKIKIDGVEIYHTKAYWTSIQYIDGDRRFASIIGVGEIDANKRGWQKRADETLGDIKPLIPAEYATYMIGLHNYALSKGLTPHLLTEIPQGAVISARNDYIYHWNKYKLGETTVLTTRIFTNKNTPNKGYTDDGRINFAIGVEFSDDAQQAIAEVHKQPNAKDLLNYFKSTASLCGDDCGFGCKGTDITIDTETIHVCCREHPMGVFEVGKLHRTTHPTYTSKEIELIKQIIDIKLKIANVRNH